MRKTKEQWHQEDLERIRNFRLLDDDFFTRVFEDSIECTELTLQIILNKPDLKVKEVHAQHTMKNLTGHSVRLDVYAVDASGKVYNIEIQRSDAGADRKRARYNSSLIDANNLNAGEEYSSLPESYVIFITEHDVLGYGLPLYTVDRTIRENGELFGDGSHILYVNAECQDDSPLGRLMQDFSCTEPDRMHYPTLKEHTRFYKENEEGVSHMCKAIEEMRDEVREEAREEGREEGREKNQLESIRALIRTLGLTIEQAMEALQVPAADRPVLLEALRKE